MTILSSLKKLHKKMTGQDTTSKTIGGILDSMQENYTSGDQTSNSAFIVEEDDQYNITTELEDIYNAALAGKQVYLKYDDLYKTLINFYQGLIGEYYFTFISLDERSINVDRLNNSKKVQESIFILENNEEPN